MLKVRYLLTSIFALALVSVPTWATETVLIAGNTPGEVFDNLLIGFMKVVATIAVTYGAIWLKRKFGIDLNAKTQEQLNELADAAVAYAEEKSATIRGRAKSKLDSNKKLQLAVEYLMPLAEKYSKDLTAEKAADLIHSRLHKMYGVGATGNGVEG